MNNKPTQDLIVEHGAIMLMLRIMEKIASKLLSGEEVDKSHIEKIVDFIKNFADKCHHGKEEDILFVELVQNPANTHEVNEYLGEHKTGRDFIRGISESLEQYQADNPDAFHIAVNMEGYIALLTEHIRKENTILFPHAEEQIPEERKKELIEKYQAFETEVTGQGKHEEYHRLLDQLQQIYL